MATLRRSIVASVLFTVFGGPCLLLVVFPWIITRFRLPAQEPEWRVGVAVMLIALGLAPLFESIVRFIAVGRGSLMPTVPTEHLVVNGLYRFVRNPMYVGVLTVIAGETLLFRSFDLAVYVVAVWAGFSLFVIFYEEPRLTRTFGVEYMRYKKHVPRWLPRIVPWRG
jgi:protein-S-isoprenylcysteine O-methyltransferase Ste14